MPHSCDPQGIKLWQRMWVQICNKIFFLTSVRCKVKILYRHSVVIGCCFLFLVVFGSKATSNMEDLELRLLQPTMSSTKMVDGALLTGTCMKALQILLQWTAKSWRRLIDQNSTRQKSKQSKRVLVTVWFPDTWHMHMYFFL